MIESIGFGGDDAPMTIEEYQYINTPRVPGFAFTAPIYDDVREPVTYPWPNCIRWEHAHKTDCRCYTQQATRLDVPESICNDIVDNGLFDHAKDNSDERDLGEQNHERTRHDSRPRSFLIGHSDSRLSPTDFKR